MCLLINLAFLTPSSSFKKTPPTETRPVLGLSNPDKMLSSVVFPEPDGPRIAIPSPLFTVKETFFKISRRRPPSQYTLLIPAASILVSWPTDDSRTLLIAERLDRVQPAGHQSRIKRGGQAQTHGQRQYHQRVGQIDRDGQAIHVINFFRQVNERIFLKQNTDAHPDRKTRAGPDEAY